MGMRRGTTLLIFLFIFLGWENERENFGGWLVRLDWCGGK